MTGSDLALAVAGGSPPRPVRATSRPGPGPEGRRRERGEPRG
ncbi:MAG: hypothetical protein AVDCRST_MAG59-2835 [uncultured Thermomicrobiales bacterium]|uniref:Uncharacterized protein n=1 Tax=uncultured Thermomicrobiales bacterium TaxID=1645740 RepID=A0A6J4UZP7_9BACT|nr:MAG: hypothetical protein AVDCRST_MAG59-2835 [uncultured Thermomicrobiales bacterium]